MTQDQLAATLYHSLRNKVMTLPDEVLVYPAHGAGSACGKNMSKETVSTIGNQKQYNYALRSNMTELEFVKEVTDGLLPPPAYFGMNVAMNKKGYESFESVFNNGMKAIDATEFEMVVEATGALILDTRNSSDFAKGFVPQSINIGINGDFAPWVGALVGDVKQPIVLITETGFEEETVTRLTRVGFDNLIGHLNGGFNSWKNAGYEIETINRITANQFASEIKIGVSKVVDVRKESEYEAEHVEEAYSRPLAFINEWVKDINPDEHFYLHCAGGYRSMIAASILQSRGYRNFTELEGGFNSIALTNVPKTDFVCKSKVLK
jgi:rhodanese-related sulfurtransferase